MPARPTSTRDLGHPGGGPRRSAEETGRAWALSGAAAMTPRAVANRSVLIGDALSEQQCAPRLLIKSAGERAMPAFVGVFTAMVVLTAVFCIIAERTMGSHSVLQDEPPSKPPRT